MIPQHACPDFGTHVVRGHIDVATLRPARGTTCAHRRPMPRGGSRSSGSQGEYELSVRVLSPTPEVLFLHVQQMVVALPEHVRHVIGRSTV